MPIEKEPDIPDDIPSWLMTFSDVITLLMTFFILLLTFATSEPETFDRMQISLFGGGGANGIAGQKDTSMDHDAVLLRERSRAGRITQYGSEMPPIHTDPVYESVAEGVAGLEASEERDLSTQHAVIVPFSLLLDSRQQVTAVGKQQLRMLAQQLRSQPLDLQFRIANKQRVSSAIALVSHLFEVESIMPGRLAVGEEPQGLDPTMVKIVLTRSLYGESHGR